MQIYNRGRPRGTSCCDTCPVRNTGICAMIDDASMTILTAHARMSRFAGGEAILDQGEPCARVGILVQGAVKVVHLTENGDEQVLQLLRPGDMVGDPFGEESGVSWEAATDVTLCWLPRGALESAFREKPMLYRAFLAGAVHELEDQRLWSAAMRGRSTLQRLAFWLSRQPVAGADHGAAIVEIDLCRRDLASLLDMSVETLCRSLHQIEQRGAIRLLAPDMIAVTDAAGLRRLSCIEEELAAPQHSGSRPRGGKPALHPGAGGPKRPTGKRRLAAPTTHRG